MDPRAPVDGFRPGWASFAEFFASGTEDDRGRPFLVELNHETGFRAAWSARGWQRRVWSTTSWLQDQGVAGGASVATLAGNSADALALAYACWVLGACAVPLNPDDSAERQAYIVKDAGIDLLVYGTSSRERAEEIGMRSPLRIRSAQELPQGEPEGWSATVETPSAGADLNIDALRVYTSGTTGDPKGVVLTAANLLTDCDALAQALGWDQGTRILTVLPVHHVNGLVISSLLPWYAGYSTVVCDRFRSDHFWNDAAAEGATVCSVVPTLLEFLLAAKEPADPVLRQVLCGAGPLLPDTVLNFQERFGVPVRHLYGLSEVTAVSAVMPEITEAQRRHWYRDFGFPSIGTAVPHVEMAVLGQDDAPLPAGRRGELAVRGATVMRGYAGQERATRDAFRNGWFHSGDEGFWEEGPEGSFYFITGRIKELIIRGGVNISPFEIDEALRSHPDVQYALAIPFENRFYGEEVAAYVVPASPVIGSAAERELEQQLLAHCTARLGFSRRPKVIIFGDEVPYTVTGKAKRLELKQRLAAHLADYRDTQFRHSADSQP